MNNKIIKCAICGSADTAELFAYTQPPAGETPFPFSESGTYNRKIYTCRLCGHMQAVHTLDLESFYKESYGDSTYGQKGIEAAFERILELPVNRSDNAGRVKKLIDFNAKYNAGRAGAPSILDVGSGLCVFLYKMQQAGWRCTAVEPGLSMAQHARDFVKVETFADSFMALPVEKKFDFITFNKVLEHVTVPEEMLAKSRKHLLESGYVYIELPDGEMAKADGPGREEFFIEHYHVFSAASLCLLACNAGFTLLEIERLQEPSTKYTLRALLRPER